MTQPNLLELAKQGDPHAIAAFINLALEPKGVIAKTSVEDHCLHVFLSSNRVLNAKTLVAFIQRGILRLEVSSIQCVQVYGQRLGDEQPDWVETFVIHRSQPADRSHLTDALPIADALPLSDAPHTADAGPIADALEALSHPSANASRHKAAPITSTRFDGWKQRWAEQKQSLQAALNNTVLTATRLTSNQVAQGRDRDDAVHEPSVGSRTKSDPTPYIKLSVLVTLIAFVTGGAVALMANSYTLGSANRKAQTTVSAIASSSQLIKSDTERNREQQQATARNYLETMNHAQQAFYRQNSRFASTLEELERFAAVPIASRSDYLYKLTVPHSNQSQLTAVPKAQGLKSYTAAVSIAKPTNQVVTAICVSQHADKVPPLVFQATNGAVQCPV